MHSFPLTLPDGEAQPLAPEEFDTLDEILDDLRLRVDGTPQWEFCEGFLVALVCCRRAVPPEEYLPVLLGWGEDELAEPLGSFRDPAQWGQFAGLWHRRWTEVRAALDAQVENLDDERCYHPELLDQRAAVLGLDEAERAQFKLEDLPAFGQVWALGFVDAVQSWPEDWAAPRDRDLAQDLQEALAAIERLTDADHEAPDIAPFGEGPATVSQARVNQLADAIWAVYALRALWRELGPRIATVRAAATPGRNDPCSCGSGKKFKKCCGA
jgi:uncharacterized protein